MHYSHFRVLKDQMKRFAMCSLDSKLPEYERKKLKYIEQSLSTMATRVQLLFPLFAFMPILISVSATPRAKVLKISLSVCLAASMPFLSTYTHNIGLFLGLPSAVNMLVVDERSGNWSSREMLTVLDQLKEEDRLKDAASDSSRSK